MTSSSPCGTNCGPRLKYIFSYVNSTAPHVFLSFPLYPPKTATTKIISFYASTIPLLIGHFRVPKTHYSQNEPKCKTFQKKSFSYKWLCMYRLSLKRRLKATQKWPDMVLNGYWKSTRTTLMFTLGGCGAYSSESEIFCRVWQKYSSNFY